MARSAAGAAGALCSHTRNHLDINKGLDLVRSLALVAAEEQAAATEFIRLHSVIRKA